MFRIFSQTGFCSYPSQTLFYLHLQILSVLGITAHSHMENVADTLLPGHLMNRHSSWVEGVFQEAFPTPGQLAVT
jgi:hypothetical protein